jgi:hypothetical protein
MKPSLFLLLTMLMMTSCGGQAPSHSGLVAGVLVDLFCLYALVSFLSEED